ncbi:hypothetical protein AURDEDRAFT_177017 [Auricularia subglabra TFB-10046 SS5]|uniref:Uncharacterized protein n=1 Tax=Auricularia subglabra (strain TFB-10046 / SS5) TaxID=717982 RepID=J0WPV5_AURST|nr:hypothetical protein AURDEDRAFT_177017 [Auricularia subglabra TFB-10046 SS5]
MPSKNILPQEFVNWATPLVRGLHEARREGTKRRYMEKVLAEFDQLPFADPSYSAYKNADGTTKITTKKQQTEADVLRMRAGEWFRNNSKETATLIRPGGKTKKPAKTRGAKATELYFASLEDDEKGGLLDQITKRLAEKFETEKDRKKHRLAMRDTVLREALSLLDDDEQENWRKKAGEMQQENRNVLASAPYLLANQQAFVNELQEFIEKRVPQLGTCGVWVHGVYMNEVKDTPTGFVVGMQSCGKEGWTDDNTYQDKILPAWRKFGSRWCTREHRVKGDPSERRKGPATTDRQAQPSSHVDGAAPGISGPDSASVRGAPEQAKSTVQDDEHEPAVGDQPGSESEDDDGPASPLKKRGTSRRVIESDDEDEEVGCGDLARTSLSPLPRSSLDGSDNDDHHNELDAHARRSRTRSPVDDLPLSRPPTPTSGSEDVVADDIEHGAIDTNSRCGKSGVLRRGRKRKAAEFISSASDDAEGMAQDINAVAEQVADVPSKGKKRKIPKAREGMSADPERTRKTAFSRELKALGATGTGMRRTLGKTVGRQTRRSSAGSGARANLRSASKLVK